jgi:beta-N-acetylhexosaminidase
MRSIFIHLGINVDCLPVLDVPSPGGHEVIGSRAYGITPEIVSVLGAAASEGLKAGGMLPVIKHIPGHGRAGADTHYELPHVDAVRSELSGGISFRSRRLRAKPWRCRHMWCSPT